jgi:hypothetical protein
LPQSAGSSSPNQRRRKALVLAPLDLEAPRQVPRAPLQRRRFDRRGPLSFRVQHDQAAFLQLRAHRAARGDRHPRRQRQVPAGDGLALLGPREKGLGHAAKLRGVRAAAGLKVFLDRQVGRVEQQDAFGPPPVTARPARFLQVLLG